MDREELKQKFREYIETRFNGSQSQAAMYYDLSYGMINHIYNGLKVPNDRILKDMGYERKIVKIEGNKNGN